MEPSGPASSRDRRGSPHLPRPHDPAVDAAVDEHGDNASETLAILRDVQAVCGGLDDQSLAAVADRLHVPDARVMGVASFYSLLSREKCCGNVVRVCDGPVCMLRRRDDVADRLRRQLDGNPQWSVQRTSCLGLCDRAPAALVNLQPCGPLGEVTAGSIVDGWRGEVPDYSQPLEGEQRVALARIGRMDPASIQSAVDAGAYQVLRDALARPPEEILRSMESSGLQGRGGAGFPTGKKWRMVAERPRGPRYVIANADESEPGAFKDRVLMEGDPHLLLEGMALAGYAVGAASGTIYLRGEYEPAARRLESAIEGATSAGWLGEDVQGSGYRFHVHLHRGAGAYICGEETALLESLEGQRGEPRVRPPYPTTHGLAGWPTLVNNVETLCKVPAIIQRGAEWYRSLGTPSSPGTKVFTVSGHVRRPCAFEAPFGITVRDAIERFGGGMQSGSRFKMALVGGAAGTIIGEPLLDVPLDFSSGQRGVTLGSGVIVAVDGSVSAAELLAWILQFFEHESCGKCTPCRQGVPEARRIVERFAAGAASVADRTLLARLAEMLRRTSLCGLGQSVAWPIESALEHFGDEICRLSNGVPLGKRDLH